MQVNTYLMFKGDCEEAFKFYAAATGGEIVEVHRYNSDPSGMPLPPGWSDKIMHARLKLGDTVIMGSDAPPGRQFGERGGFQLSLGFPTKAEAERVFAALSEGGKIGMPMGPTFFAAAFGMATDRFGLSWMVICEKEG